jgi:hypothetical protein
MNDNSTKNHAGEICTLAATIGELCEEAIDDPKAATPARFVALRALAADIGALADELDGGRFHGDAAAWMPGRDHAAA